MVNTVSSDDEDTLREVLEIVRLFDADEEAAVGLGEVHEDEGIGV